MASTVRELAAAIGERYQFARKVPVSCAAVSKFYTAAVNAAVEDLVAAGDAFVNMLLEFGRSSVPAAGNFLAEHSCSAAAWSFGARRDLAGPQRPNHILK